MSIFPKIMVKKIYEQNTLGKLMISNQYFNTHSHSLSFILLHAQILMADDINYLLIVIFSTSWHSTILAFLVYFRRKKNVKVSRECKKFSSSLTFSVCVFFMPTMPSLHSDKINKKSVIRTLVSLALSRVPSSKHFRN